MTTSYQGEIILGEIDYDKLQSEIKELQSRLTLQEARNHEADRMIHQLYVENRKLEEYVQIHNKYNVVNNLYLKIREKITHHHEMKVIKASNVFDAQYYGTQYPHTALRNQDALKDYIINGTRERLSPYEGFDAEYYMARNVDVREKYINPLYHYLKYGFYEGRKPSESADMYLEWCKRQSKTNKYIRLIYALKDGYYIYKSGLFDGEYYFQTNQDVKETLVNSRFWNLRSSKNKIKNFFGKVMTSAITHYVRYGVYENRNPNSTFDGSYYINQNVDILGAKHMNPFTHYVRYGLKEGRKAHRDICIENNILDFIERYIDKYANKIEEYHVGIIVPPTYKVNEIEKYIEMIEAQEFKACNIVFLDFEKEGQVTDRINEYINSHLENRSIKLEISQEDWKKENYYIEAFKATKAEIIWMPALTREYTPQFLSKTVPYFIDSAVKVVTHKVIEKANYTADMSDIKYATTGQCEAQKLLDGKLEEYELQGTLFRNPINTSWFADNNWLLKDRESFRHFIIRMLCVGNIVYLQGEYFTDIKPQIEYIFNTNEICKKHQELLMDIKQFYSITAQQLKAEYEKVRTSYLTTSGKTIDHFLGVYNIEQVMAMQSKPRIVISLIAFTHGGGEIMPIRLANQLYEMGYPVIVHNYHHDNDEIKVRKMLNPNITVVETNREDELFQALKLHKMDVISTHHQGLQSFVTRVLRKDEELKKHINHVGTSHGMYENFDEDVLTHIFKQLEGGVDYWTYVADKNLVPFKAHNVYDESRFIKIPNGMKVPEIHPIKRSEMGISEDAFVVCTVSRALKQKGWLETIESVKLARKLVDKDIQLILIGDGPLYEELSQTELDEFVHLLGFRDNPCDYYAISDLAMLTSYYKSESAPLTIIEALFSGIPVIASNIGDIKQMLSIGENLAGDIFDLQEGTVPIEIVAEKLVNLIKDKEVYKQKVELAKAKSKTFEIHNVADRYIDVYTKKLDKEENIGKCMDEINTTNILLSNSCRGYHCPKVSVIVPNYNHEKFLRQRLDCIYNQTYKNLEVILMDDCSKDESRRILNEYAEKYPDITVKLFNEVNSGGVFHQWTKGIKNATGDICWIAESDDYCDLNFIEKLIPAFEDSKVRISYCKYMFVNSKGEHNEYGFSSYVEEIDDEKWTKSYVADAQEEVENALSIKNTIPNVSGALFRRPIKMDLFNDNKWLNMRICGDWIFYLQLLKGGKVAFNVETQSYFRFHENNSSAHTYTRDTYYKEHEMVACAIKDLYNVSNECLERNYELIKAFYFEHTKGTEKDFNMLFNIKKVLERKKAFIPTIIVNEPEDIRKDRTTNTVLINPVISAGRNLDAPLEEQMLYVGANTGNLLFAEGMKEQLNYVRETWFRASEFTGIDNISAVMPSANFIIHGNNDSLAQKVIALLEGITGNVTLAGLGAQSTKELNTPKKLVSVLTPTKRKFLKMVSERAVSIGVRGMFTAECLEEMGIHNYRIIGCPSAYKYLDGKYPRLKEPTIEHVMFTTTTGNSYETKILEMGMENNATWIMQMMTEMPEVALEGKMPVPFWMNYRFPGLKASQEELKAYMQEHAKIFFRLKDWYDYYEKEQFTFSYGSRFHGNMSALLNGIPALWIVHDSRTTELVNTLKLPHIDLNQFDKIKSLEELISYCDYEEFYKNYGAMTKEYVKFLEENHLKHKFTV